MTDSTRDLLRTLSRILLRGWLIGYAILLVWFAMLLSGVVVRWHGPWFGLSAHELYLIHYCGMGLLKLAVLALFFVPWVVVRIELGREA